MINFVTEYCADDMNGGWNGTSGNTHLQLKSRLDVHYVGPIKPPIPIFPKVASKAMRGAGVRGSLPVYGNSRLDRIARLYAAGRYSNAHFDEFHGATPWLHCRPQVPYGIYIDATFPLYMAIYSNPNVFSRVVQAKVEDKEQKFMANASVLFFGSDWVKEDAIERYGLDPARTRTIYTGGKVPVPEQDVYAGGHTFLFIAHNFERKGGRVAAEAIQRVRARNLPTAELMVFGELPPPDVRALPGVSYGGMLRKDVPEELETLCCHLADARGLIHPTSQDTMGSVLIEAAYHGTPAITTRRFGIPEFVIDGKTGFLVDAPANVDAIATHLARMCENGPAYEAMRRAAFAHSHENLTWEAFGKRMIDGISPFLEPGQTRS